MQNAANSMITTNQQPNLIEWQLELDNILERIDHLLRGHTLEQDKDQNYLWIKPKDDNLAVFNEYGVQEILRILSLYLNRNTILSNYTEEEVRVKMEDFSYELIDLIYLKYEEMGLTTVEKRKNYPILVRSITDTINSTFNRAIGGGERESLRTARTVTQMDPIGRNQVGSPLQKKQFSFSKPNTWLNT